MSPYTTNVADAAISTESPPASPVGAPYHYFDDTPGAVKSHSFDLAHEVYHHLSESPCTGINITVVD